MEAVTKINYKSLLRHLGIQSCNEKFIHYSNDGNPNNNTWLFIEEESNIVKGGIKEIKFPICFSLNINNILIKKENFRRVETHDHHTFIRVVSLN